MHGFKKCVCSIWVTQFYLKNMILFIDDHKKYASLVAQMVKNPSAMRETWVRSLGFFVFVFFWSLGWDNPLKENMETHTSCPCWENPMDRGNWWIMDHGVAKCWTRMKWVSMLTTPKVASSFSHWIIIPVHPLASQSFSDMYCHHSFLHNFTPKVSLTIKVRISWSLSWYLLLEDSSQYVNHIDFLTI